MRNNRGVMTPEIQAKGEELLGGPFDVEDLRLIPFIVYSATNGGFMKGEHIRHTEYSTIAMLEAKGHLRVTETLGMEKPDRYGPGATRVYFDLTKSGWEALNEIVWLGYAQPDKTEGPSA